MDPKQAAAEKAVEFIQDGTIVGLGAGSAVGYMVGFLKLKVENGLEVKLLTSSFTTRKLLQEYNFIVQDTAAMAQIDQYFDGCDQFDHQLHALKSGGGIHTREKILAEMAREFILVGDESKYVEKFDVKFPLVIEVLQETLSFVPVRIQKHFPGIRTEIRMSNKKDGAVITENGNYLFDLWFREWPGLSEINPILKQIPGIIETSLFYNIAHKAVIGGSEGVRVLYC